VDFPVIGCSLLATRPLRKACNRDLCRVTMNADITRDIENLLNCWPAWFRDLDHQSKFGLGASSNSYQHRIIWLTLRFGDGHEPPFPHNAVSCFRHGIRRTPVCPDASVWHVRSDAGYLASFGYLKAAAPLRP
jgi:hypothetical protein